MTSSRKSTTFCERFLGETRGPWRERWTALAITPPRTNRGRRRHCWFRTVKIDWNQSMGQVTLVSKMGRERGSRSSAASSCRRRRVRRGWCRRRGRTIHRETFRRGHCSSRPSMTSASSSAWRSGQKSARARALQNSSRIFWQSWVTSRRKAKARRQAVRHTSPKPRPASQANKQTKIK